ncbi:sorbitol dehydrogenase [Pyrenophora tritici-repentis Pt-1C-BFP]|uniref:Sorbitol dehydrogenase n=1 Tax=Pyrenophora tritici-repentis (strain Pt-1C-BFP) TaxID=426418 RepID=B2WL99_PYRTR|nr:sorbitol dehydrogenase [Pyrenophora tritici-repentis Pt-1C-BFP]EDU43809.1 sorbitol dehydrogenase [Pyrenophora tritici-repentis Pt-1C-BFP]
MCFLCTSGRYNLCKNVAFLGVYPTNGTIQRYKTHPARYCHKLPPNVSYVEGALLEPLSVVLQAVKSADFSLGRGALICGAGPIGLMALAAARASGAHPLVITDLEPGRLVFAQKFVPAVKTYLVDRGLDAKGNAEKIRVLFEGGGGGVGEYGAPQTVLECTGAKSSVATAVYAARLGGTIKLKFSQRYCDTWPAGLQCLAGGIVDLKPMVTHTFPLEKAVDALHICGDYGNGSVKVQIVDEVDDVL